MSPPFFIMLSVPQIETGITGAPDLHCQMERAFFEGLKPPVRERVPSTKVITCTPDCRTRAADAHALFGALKSAVAVHWNEVAQLHAVAEDRDLHQ